LLKKAVLCKSAIKGFRGTSTTVNDRSFFPEKLGHDPSRKHAQNEGDHQYDCPRRFDLPEKKTDGDDLRVLDDEQGK
jgi:hypothetical protein